MPEEPEDKEEYSDAAARYYDAVYDVLRRESGDAAFYISLARETGGPVLELGCGTGRVLLPIAREGIACTGLDSSEPMIERLRARNPPANLRLAPGRMERFELPWRYALIFSAFRAFQHLLTVEDQLACLSAVRRHLAPGGLFAFDVFAPRLERTALAEEPETEDARWRDGAAEVLRFASVRRDPARQLMDVTFRYERRMPGSAPRSETVRTRMRYFFRYELEHLLVRAGFTRVEFFGGFDRRPYDYFSGETVVLACTGE